MLGQGEAEGKTNNHVVRLAVFAEPFSSGFASFLPLGHGSVLPFLIDLRMRLGCGFARDGHVDMVSFTVLRIQAGEGATEAVSEVATLTDSKVLVENGMVDHQRDSGRSWPRRADLPYSL